MVRGCADAPPTLVTTGNEERKVHPDSAIEEDEGLKTKTPGQVVAPSQGFRVTVGIGYLAFKRLTAPTSAFYSPLSAR